MNITGSRAYQTGASVWQAEDIEHEWPNGIELTLESVRLFQQRGLDIGNWMSSLLTKDQQWSLRVALAPALRARLAVENRAHRAHLDTVCRALNSFRQGGSYPQLDAELASAHAARRALLAPAWTIYMEAWAGAFVQVLQTGACH